MQGMQEIPMIYGNKNIKEKIYLLDDLDAALLSKFAIKVLCLIKCLCNVRMQSLKPIEEHFKDLFNRLSCFPGEYCIELVKKVNPFAKLNSYHIAAQGQKILLDRIVE